MEFYNRLCNRLHDFERRCFMKPNHRSVCAAVSVLLLAAQATACAESGTPTADTVSGEPV